MGNKSTKEVKDALPQVEKNHSSSPSKGMAAKGSPEITSNSSPLKSQVEEDTRMAPEGAEKKVDEVETTGGDAAAPVPHALLNGCKCNPCNCSPCRCTDDQAATTVPSAKCTCNPCTCNPCKCGDSVETTVAEVTEQQVNEASNEEVKTEVAAHEHHEHHEHHAETETPTESHASDEVVASNETSNEVAVE